MNTKQVSLPCMMLVVAFFAQIIKGHDQNRKPAVRYPTLLLNPCKVAKEIVNVIHFK